VLFASIFLATRDLLLAVCLACAATLVIEGLLNESSSICVLPLCRRMRMRVNRIPVAHRANLLGVTMVRHGAPDQARAHEQAQAGDLYDIDDPLD
jgi:hypothetical protein